MINKKNIFFIISFILEKILNEALKLVIASIYMGNFIILNRALNYMFLFLKQKGLKAKDYKNF